MPSHKAIQMSLLAALFFVAGALSGWLVTDQSEDVVRAKGSKFELHNYTAQTRWMVFDPETGDTWVLRSNGWRYYKLPKRSGESEAKPELPPVGTVLTKEELQKRYGLTTEELDASIKKQELVREIEEELRRRGIDPEQEGER